MQFRAQGIQLGFERIEIGLSYVLWSLLEECVVQYLGEWLDIVSSLNRQRGNLQDLCDGGKDRSGVHHMTPLVMAALRKSLIACWAAEITVKALSVGLLRTKLRAILSAACARRS